MRWGKWKITFTEMYRALPTAWKKSPSWPLITNLRLDPYVLWFSDLECLRCSR